VALAQAWLIIAGMLGCIFAQLHWMAKVRPHL
jgi:hypothetical protein